MFVLSILPESLAICRLDPQTSCPEWANAGSLSSITRTTEELSILCPQEHVPEGVMADRDWRALKIQGPLDFAMVGVLSELAGLLAAAKVSIFAISTFETDYILVKADKLRRAIEALRIAGHHVVQANATSQKDLPDVYVPGLGLKKV